VQTKPSELSPVDQNAIRDFLMGHPVGVLATVDAVGDPHASTIYFSVDSDLTITFTTKRDTRKYENIAHHTIVMLAVYDSESQTVVQVKGAAQEVVDPIEAQKIYHGTLHAAKQTGEDNVPPIAKIAAGPYVAFKVSPDNIWMSSYGWGDSFAAALDSANEASPSGDPS
jgi:general stress protein 26